MCMDPGQRITVYVIDNMFDDSKIVWHSLCRLYTLQGHLVSRAHHLSKYGRQYKFIFKIKKHIYLHLKVIVKLTKTSPWRDLRGCEYFLNWDMSFHMKHGFCFLLFKCIYLFWERDRERQSERERTSEGQREGDRENPKRTPHHQHRARCQARTHEPWHHDLSWNQEPVNRLSHPGTPQSIVFLLP